MNGQHCDRREWIKTMVALSTGVTGGWAGWAHAQVKPLTVGFIYVGPRDDYGYNQAHAEGAALIKKLPGVKVIEEENVP